MKTSPAARAVAAAIAQTTSASFELVSTNPVSGGCIHTALEITGRTSLGEQRYFAKVNEADRAPMFAAEADGLVAVSEAGALRVPRVITHGSDDDLSWLVLEWLDLGPLVPASAAALGTALAAQHRIAQRTFGWPRDNFIGATAQKNTPSEDWLAFWRHHRLHAQLRLAAANRLPSPMIDRGERLAADCGAFFRGYAPQRSLLHGDLWGGNASSLPDGTPVVFDPAVYVGDREADVAMTELFGGYPRDFLAAYRNHWPLDGGYTVRRDFYNLYHVLNHANLFAGEYVRQSGDAIEKLLAEIA